MYPMAVYTNDITVRIMSLLAYPMAVYRIGKPNYSIPKALNSMFPMVVPPKIHIIARVPSGCVHKIYMSLLAYLAVGH